MNAVPRSTRLTSCPVPQKQPSVGVEFEPIDTSEEDQGALDWSLGSLQEWVLASPSAAFSTIGRNDIQLGADGRSVFSIVRGINIGVQCDSASPERQQGRRVHGRANDA